MKYLLMIFLLGISPVAYSVTLDWDAVATNTDGTPLTDLAGYTVYQSTSSFHQAGVWKSTANASSDPSITPHNVAGGITTYSTSLVPGTPYFFRLTAYNQSSVQSGFNVDGAGSDVEVSTVTAVVGVSCDINGDGALNVSDAQTDINAALGVCTRVCDVNQDGLCTVTDVQRVINAVLGGPC